MKVGNMLVRNRVITEAQLEEALKNQVIFGGKLGTNLIELGYITPDKLAEFLSRHKGVPAATVQDTWAIPPEVIALIPVETVKAHQVLPLSRERRKLTVAMVNPADLATIDKLGFMTGMNIVPVIIPELVLYGALERYYKIKRETRYIAIAKSMKRDPRSEPAEDLHEIKPPAPAPPPEQPAEEEYIEIPGDFDGFHKVDIPELPPAPAVEETAAGYDLTEMCAALAGAVTRDAIGEALTEYLRRRYFRAALFLPKEALITGWLAASADGYQPNFGDVRIEMALPSSFLQVIDTKNFVMGQLLSPTDYKAASAISSQDRPAILLPIVLMNRVVAILCVVDTLEGLTRGLAELQKIAVKAAMAFEILIMRNKIQMI
jgi:hypothetical protein